jgi:Uma2 family endonuclease
MPGGNVRTSDVSYVAKGRFQGDVAPEGFPDLAPDLAVEVLSPEARPRQVLDKIGEYLQAGVRLVWVIDPRTQTAAVYRSLTDVLKLQFDDALDGEAVIEGFRCPLRSVLE